MEKTTRKFDAALFLDSEDMIVAYLKEAFDEGDFPTICTALSDIVRAKGVLHMSSATGLTPSTLNAAFGEKGEPPLSTLLAIVKALGVKLSVTAQDV